MTAADKERTVTIKSHESDGEYHEPWETYSLTALFLYKLLTGGLLSVYHAIRGYHERQSDS